MPRLVINPGTPQAWEIQLKPGLNFLGRGASNDFKIEDGSVSGSHCQILVEDGITTIKDLGSTNGTYVNRAKVMESRLESGQPFRLGSVDMIFYHSGPDAVTSVTVPPPDSQSTPPAPPPPPPTPLKPGGSLRISGFSPPPQPAAVVATTDAPPAADSLDPAAPAEITGTRYCKFHPKSPARFLCNKCNRTFCDLCVISRNVGAKVVKTCRSCGVECVPVHFQAAAQKSFYTSLAGAFTYPLKGAGIIIIICATVAFAAMDFVSRFFCFGIVIAIALYGFIFMFMQNIIQTTTADESEEISFPESGSLFGAALQLAVTSFAAFWLWIALVVARYSGVDIPVEAIIAARILGEIYFPMALLAVAMKDSAVAANPLVVIPAMMKVPGQYAITVVLLLMADGVRSLAELLSKEAGSNMMSKDMSTFFVGAGIKSALGLVSVYLLCVTMRILGLFYNASKQKLGWFTH